MSLKVAVQIFSVLLDAKANLQDTLTKIKEIGYDGVEMGSLWGHDPADLKKMYEDLDLVPISAHLRYEDMVANPEELLSKYAYIGCKYIAVPYLSEDKRPGTEGFGEVAENIKMLGEVAKKHGMSLLYHNHDFEFSKIAGKYALDFIYDTIPSDLLKTELDTCWVNVGGEIPAEYIMKYSGRSPLVHLKDFYGEPSDDNNGLVVTDRKTPLLTKNFEFRPVGFGVQDFPSILVASEKAGADWVVVEQDKPSMGLTAMECIKKSREYLRTLGY